MKLVTSKQMRELDLRAIDLHGISSLKLMERAGLALANAVSKLVKKGPVSIIVGKGNNGGDGLVAARHLIDQGFDVNVVILENQSALSTDSKANFDLLAPMTQHIFTATTALELASIAPRIAQSTCIVDAILGTGLEKDVKGVAASAVDFINSLKIKVVSADIPSGLSADTGRPLGRAVNADVTVTFGLPKLGLFIGDGTSFSGRVEVADIGLPELDVASVESNFEMIEPAMFKKYFEPRKLDSHKGNYGHVVIFSGSRGHIGAGFLSSKAALRSGCGLVTYCLPEKAFAKFDARYPEVMCDSIPDDGRAFFSRESIEQSKKILDQKSSAAIGPAIGTEPETAEFVNAIVREAKLPLVVDADGLNVLNIDSLKRRTHATVLTPHPGEMASLVNKTTSEVQAQRAEVAVAFAKSTNSIVVLKGYVTIVARPDGHVAFNPTGNPGMATAGMGDALTGMIASFLAQGMPPFDASCAAVYLHGLAGDLASKEHGERSLITSDVISEIGKAIELVTRHA